MKRKPYHELPPTRLDVLAAWMKVYPDSPSFYTDRGHTAMRAFFQGVISQHLEQQAAPRGTYLAPTAAQRRAITITRAWLEFSP